MSALDPSAGPGVGNGYYGRASALNPNNISNAGTALTRKLGRRTAMVGGYTFDRTYFTEEVRWNQSQRAFASIDRRLSRRTTVTGGYAYRATDYTTNDSLSSSSSHDLDMRFTYTREAPQGKSTSLRAGLGSSFVDEFGRQYHGWRWLVDFDHAVSTRWILARQLRPRPALSRVCPATHLVRRGRRHGGGIRQQPRQAGLRRQLLERPDGVQRRRAIRHVLGHHAPAIGRDAVGGSYGRLHLLPIRLSAGHWSAGGHAAPARSPARADSVRGSGFPWHGPDAPARPARPTIREVTSATRQEVQA